MYTNCLWFHLVSPVGGSWRNKCNNQWELYFELPLSSAVRYKPPFPWIECSNHIKQWNNDIMNTSISLSSSLFSWILLPPISVVIFRLSNCLTFIAIFISTCKIFSFLPQLFSWKYRMSDDAEKRLESGNLINVDLAEVPNSLTRFQMYKDFRYITSLGKTLMFIVVGYFVMIQQGEI